MSTRSALRKQCTYLVHIALRQLGIAEELSEELLKELENVDALHLEARASERCREVLPVV